MSIHFPRSEHIPFDSPCVAACDAGMENYSSFAPFYDRVMDHVDYQRWYLYLCHVMIEYVNNPRVVLELGCGTGKFGAKFSAEDFEIYGIDLSFEMLQVAKARAFKNFRIMCADIREFAFKRKFDFIFCVHDTLNYFQDPGDLRKVFRCVRNVMHPESIFLFDVTTEYNINAHFDGQCFMNTMGDTALEWTNFYDEETKVVTSILHFMKSDGTTSTEFHYQKLYPVDEIKEILVSEGFVIKGIYGDYTMDPPDEKTVMINFVVSANL